MYEHKETFEWINSWCDYAPNNDLPRVLLVGDSICQGYQQAVRELLRGKCYVDFFANTYAVDSPIYRALFKLFYKDSHYDLVHFNHGLHGGHMRINTYKNGLEKLLMNVDTKLTIATSTIVYEEGNDKIHKGWMKLVNKRNEALRELAVTHGYEVNDLFATSAEIPKEYRYQDGIHYVTEGYKVLAKQVAKSITETLGL